MLYLGTMMRIRSRFFIPLFIAVLFAGCRSPAILVDEPEFMKAFDPTSQEFPLGFRFQPEPVPLLDIPPDVGTLSEYPAADSGDPVTAAFHEAYVEALLRGLPLEGVLGGDRVHFWPDNNPQARIQNWTSGAGEANSWGFPGMVLAIGGAGNPDRSYRVYTVSGRILDRYGRSPGPNIGNGVAGYGYPAGEVFFRDGAAVQDFSRGSIVVDKAGAAFIPSAAVKEADSGPPGRLPEHEDFSGLAPEIAGAFSTARETLGRGSTEQSDGPVVNIAFSDPWIIPGPGIPVSGVYIKSYDTGKSIFVFVDAPALPKRARFLTGPFLTILLHSGNRLPGAENETLTVPISGAENPYIKALLEGFSLYGVPLSDRLAVELDEPGTFREAQRFSKGWIIAPPPVNSAGDEAVSGKTESAPVEAVVPVEAVPAEAVVSAEAATNEAD